MKRPSGQAPQEFILLPDAQKKEILQVALQRIAQHVAVSDSARIKTELENPGAWLNALCDAMASGRMTTENIVWDNIALKPGERAFKMPPKLSTDKARDIISAAANLMSFLMSSERNSDYFSNPGMALEAIISKKLRETKNRPPSGEKER